MGGEGHLDARSREGDWDGERETGEDHLIGQGDDRFSEKKGKKKEPGETSHQQDVVSPPSATQALRIALTSEIRRDERKGERMGKTPISRNEGKNLNLAQHGQILGGERGTRTSAGVLKRNCFPYERQLEIL